jgi:hydroxyethylthiazole kinase-like sugar kinase family protein
MSLVRPGPGTGGADSRHAPEEVLEDARALSLSAGCVVSVSGTVDIIVDRHGRTASAITGGFSAVDLSPFAAAAYAMALTGIACERVEASLAESERSRLLLPSILEDEKLVKEALRESEARVRFINKNFTAGMIHQVDSASAGMESNS